MTLIAGPTASGKSAFALALAERDGAHIINADSMQVYDVLNVLTARPDAAQRARARHHLYGHVSPAHPYSTGQWLRDVQALLADLPSDTPLIFVGGTGLYFRALTEGLAPMPDVPADLRASLRAQLANKGARALHDELVLCDRATAETLQPTDGQRIVRALEVFKASGRSIRDWRVMRTEPIVGASRIVDRFVLAPQRDQLNARIDARFDTMIADGALEEVRQLRQMALEPDLPAMKAIGVRELGAVIDGAMSADAAIAAAKTATRRYAKRQMTWFRRQLDARWQKPPADGVWATEPHITED